MAHVIQSKTNFFHRVELENVTNTDNFSTTDACIGCGQCASVCPAYAIKMEDDHPTWIGDTCLVCFGCLRLCPAQAIRYGAHKAPTPERSALHE